MELGVQLYGCMKEFRADPEAFCARLSAAGYTQLEPCTALAMPADVIGKLGINPVWQPEEMEGFAELMKKHGLALTTSHIFGDARKDADKAAALAEKCGLKYIVVNCPGGDKAEDYEAFAEDCLYLAEKLAAVGTELWIHNGWPEIRAKINGKTALEYVLERCGGKVGTQIDVGWALYGGEDPMAYLEKVKPYLKSIHYKDIRKEYKELDLNAIHISLGKGAVNWQPIHAFATANGVPEVIDQDASPADFIMDLEETAALLKNV